MHTDGMQEPGFPDETGWAEAHTRLADSRVVIIGAGGLGSPVALRLAAAGVGTLVILDPDVVDASNLNRQLLYRTFDLGRVKVEAARARIRALYPGVRVDAHAVRLEADNAAAFFAAADFVVDATDGMESKFLVNDAAVLARCSYSHAGVLGFEGQTMTVVPGETACLRCLFPEPPPPDAVPACREAGIIGGIAGVIGSIQAAETVKAILGRGTLLRDRLFTYDARSRRSRSVSLARNPRCPVCSDRPSITTLASPPARAPGACA